MPEFVYENEPDAPFAEEGQPLFFRRLWDGALMIYGYSYRLTGEDWAKCRESWEFRRSFFTRSFSQAEPRGEVGFQPLNAVEEISREEFERAAADGWPSPSFIQRFPR
jgi:hypothetical protein